MTISMISRETTSINQIKRNEIDMKPIIYCYERCGTCKKALKWLEENEVDFISRSITEETPSADDLRQLYERSELKLRRFFNTSGMKYRELKLSKRLPEMSESEQLELLASDGMLIKRPLMITDDAVLLGFKPDIWQEILL